MQRIWTQEELKTMPEWRRGEYGDWMHKDHRCWIDASMVGKPIESIMAKRTIKDYMIAKEPKEETIKQNNMETKKVTLNNGTVLEVGKKYQVNDEMPFEIKCIGDDMLFVKDEEGIECCQVYNKRMNILPYTPKKEWKTFLIEVKRRGADVSYRFFNQYESEEQVRKHHPKAISITEVKINIEPINI